MATDVDSSRGAFTSHPRDCGPAERILETQLGLARLLIGARDLREVLQHSIDWALDATGMDAGGIYLTTDEEPPTLVLVPETARGLTPSFIEAASRYEPGSTQHALVMAAEPRFTHARELGLPDELFAGGQTIRAIASIPLQFQDEVLGSLNVASFSRDDFPSRARDVLEIVSTQLGTAVSRLRAEEELQRHREHLEELVEQRTRELRASEQRAFRFLESVPAGVFILDGKTGAPLYANRRSQWLLGQGLVSRASTTELAHAYQAYIAGTDEPYPTHRMPLVRALKGASTSVDDMEIRHPDRTVPLHVTGTPILDERGEVEYAVAAFVDVGDRAKIEDDLRDALAKLERSNRDLEQFAYVSSHDLQEPLRMVSSYTQLIADRLADHPDEDIGEFVGYAVDGAKRMQQLILDLLAFSRVGTRGGNFEPTSLDDSVSTALQSLRSEIDATTAEITVGELPEVVGDPAQLTQLFECLLSNGLKFSGPARPKIEISARDESSEWVVSVRDEGLGLSPEHAERIFVIFKRLQRREDFSGTGIGLAVAKRIVERHGGRIWVDSSPGEGATFSFSLPKKANRTGQR